MSTKGVAEDRPPFVEAPEGRLLLLMAMKLVGYEVCCSASVPITPSPFWLLRKSLLQTHGSANTRAQGLDKSHPRFADLERNLSLRAPFLEMNPEP